MRVLIAMVLLLFGAAAASAADVDGARAGHVVVRYGPVGRPAGQVLTYDWESGVVVRPYWLSPWRDRHYFPFGRDRFDVHRKRAHWVPPRPARSYYRSWSASSGLAKPPRHSQSPRTHPPIQK